MLQRSDAKQLGKRLSEIRKRPTRRRDRRRRAPMAEHQQRHVLARVIGARRRGIVAVIGGDDQQIAGADARAAIADSRASKRSRLAA